MSCNCNITNNNGGQFVCSCDSFVFPPELNISAGLSDLPRQVAGFPEFRQAMLYSIRSQAPLASWQARGQQDLGIMMIEWWAYICDVISFYDKVIANEEYLATASQRPSLRKLVALLGYIPMPAIAGTATLAALASGKQKVNLKNGMAFRSGSFDGNPPQVFQLDNDTTINPFSNSWQIAPYFNASFEQRYNTRSFLILPQVVIKANDLLLLIDNSSASAQVLQVGQATTYVGISGLAYTELTFPLSITNQPPVINSSALISDLQLLQARRYAQVTTFDGVNTITLDSVYPDIALGDYILIKLQQEVRWFKVLFIEIIPPSKVKIVSTFNQQDWTWTHSSDGTNSPAYTSITLDIGANDSTRTDSELNNMPPIKRTLDFDNAGRSSGIEPAASQDFHRGGGHTTYVPATPNNWVEGAEPMLCYYGLQLAGTISNDASNPISSEDTPLVLQQPVDASVINAPASSSMILQDPNQNVAEITGTIAQQNNAPVLQPDNSNPWVPFANLNTPVTVFGNVVNISRGQSVSNEVLGNGDATTSNQVFKLNKSPLTYLQNAAALRGIKSTLSVYVNGALWSEVPNFYGIGPLAQVYVVRQNDSGDTLITFGDGIRGQRLPTGSGNVVAYYRYGAGLASPPANSINQIVNPVSGLSSVNNPLAGVRGADAEPAESLRSNAPLSALTLGRAVSMQDMQAIVLAIPNVSNALAQWGWSATAQCAVANIWYIGLAEVSFIQQRLNSMSDPTVTINVMQATPCALPLNISITIDPRYIPADIISAVYSVFTGAGGLLTSQMLGIDKPLFYSSVFETALSVTGVLSVDFLEINNIQPLNNLIPEDNDYGISPDSISNTRGSYFDFTLTITQS